mmetsp:Transcript_37633/g.91349  ORF Transcript_37633/g.91349 Transcript_37633/m.91349 type:complete len:87 (-) Transcript_37633:2913-3173(-)
MVCFQRGPNEKVPGCLGGESEGSRVDYCVLSKDRMGPLPTAPPVSGPGVDKPIKWSTNFPLGECEGGTCLVCELIVLHWKLTYFNL